MVRGVYEKFWAGTYIILDLQLTLCAEFEPFGIAA